MTQIETVKSLLRHEGGVTSMDAFQHGITRLAEYIRLLRRKYGWAIHTELRPNPNGHGKYAKYTLIKEA